MCISYVGTTYPVNVLPGALIPTDPSKQAADQMILVPVFIVISINLLHFVGYC